jgi:uncharacterized membrane protein YgcG
MSAQMITSMAKFFSGITFATAALLITPPVSAQTGLRPLPPRLSSVSDEVGALSPDQGRALAEMITDIEQASGVRVIVLIAETTRPEDIESYTQRLSSLWMAQRPAMREGKFVFVVIAVSDRALRIAGGKPMGAIVDEVTKSQVMTDIIPMFRSKDYFQAAMLIVRELSNAIRRGSQLNGRPTVQRRQDDGVTATPPMSARAA